MQVWDILHLYARTHNQFQNTDRMWPSVCIHLTPLPKNSHWEAFCYIFCHLFSYIKAKKKKNETSMTRLKIFMSYHSWWLNYLLGCCGVTVCVCGGGGEGKIKPVKLRLAVSVACGRELDCIYGFGGEEQEWKRLLRRPRRRWKDSVNVKGKGW